MIALAAVAALASVSLAVWSSLGTRPITADPSAQVSIPRATTTPSPSPTEGDTPTPTPSPSPMEIAGIELGDYQTYHNERFDYSISYPSNYLVMQSPPPANGAGRKFVSKDGRVEMVVNADHNALEQSLREIYEEELKQSREVTYKVLKKKWFIVSGYENNKIFYQKTTLKDDIVKTFRIEADRELRAVVEPMTEQMVKSFK